MKLVLFQAEDGIRDSPVTGVQTCALPISYLPVPTGFCALYLVQIPLHVIFVRILYRIYDYIRLILKIIPKKLKKDIKFLLIYIENVINFKKNL